MAERLRQRLEAMQELLLRDVSHELRSPLVWVPPTTNTDGTPLSNLAGFTIDYGNSAGSMTQTIDVPSAGATGHTVQGLTAGTWYFTVTAYTSVGTRSAPSDVASKTIS